MNPVALNSAPMSITLCTCGHAYIYHVPLEPSRKWTTHKNRPCRCCPCAQFDKMSDEQYLLAEKPEEDAIQAEYLLLRQQERLPEEPKLEKP